MISSFGKVADRACVPEQGFSSTVLNPKVRQMTERYIMKVTFVPRRFHTALQNVCLWPRRFAIAIRAFLMLAARRKNCRSNGLGDSRRYYLSEVLCLQILVETGALPQKTTFVPRRFSTPLGVAKIFRAFAPRRFHTALCVTSPSLYPCVTCRTFGFSTYRRLLSPRRFLSRVFRGQQTGI